MARGSVLVMTKKQIEEVKKVVGDAVRDELTEMDKRIESHRIAIFGQNNDNGLTGTVKDHSTAIERIRIANAKAAALYSVLAGAGGLIGSILVKVFFK